MTPLLDVLAENGLLGGLAQFDPQGAAPDFASPEEACASDAEPQWVVWHDAAGECEWAAAELTALASGS